MSLRDDIERNTATEAARALANNLGATRGRALLEKLQAWYGGPWASCIPEDLIAHALADLRLAGFDVATAAESDAVREASYDVPIRRAE